MSKAKRICDSCGTIVEFGNLHRVIKEGKKVYFCKICYQLNRQNHRQETIKESGIAPELKELDRKLIVLNQEIKLGREVNVGKIGRPKKEKQVSNFLGTSFSKIKQPRIALALSKDDKQTLYRSCRTRGLNHKEAVEEVERVNEYLKELGKTLRRDRKLTQEKANEMFKEEFNKICYS